MVETLESTTYQNIATTVVVKTQIGSDIVLPAWARQIVSIRPVVACDVGTAAESILTKFSIESDDIQGLSPFEVPGAPAGAFVGTIGTQYQDKAPTYYVGAACSGGNRLRCYVQALVSNTGALTTAMEIRISDQSPQFPQRHAKMGTLTSSGTAASADVAGTAYQVTGGNRIVEVNATYGPTTVGAAAAVCGYFKLTSSEFQKSMPFKMQMEPIPANLATTAWTQTRLNHQPVDIPIQSPCTIQDYFFMGLAPGTAGNFVVGVIYE